MASNKTLYQIKENVKKVGERIFEANNFQFRRGFNMCFEFFDIELNKTVLVHQSTLFYKIERLEAELANKNIQLNQLAQVSEFGVIAIQEELQKKLNVSESEVDLLKRIIADQAVKITSLDNKATAFEMKYKALEDKLKTRKTNKKYKKLIEFITYRGLEADLNEFYGESKGTKPE